MQEQGVTDLRRIKVHRDGILKPTHTFVFTFNTPILPKTVKIGFIQTTVDVYVPNPLRCYGCQVFGHHKNKCGRQASCVNCGEPEHCPSGSHQSPAKCVNCSGDHPSSSKVCPSWEKEKKIVKIKVEQNITFPEAHIQYEAKSYASAVRPSTCNKTTQTEDKSTQTGESITNKTKQKQSHKRNHKKNSRKRGTHLLMGSQLLKRHPLK